VEPLTNIAYIRELLNRHGFTFSKQLGQNFLINPSVCPRMAEMGGAQEGVAALEVGPGIGVLTAELAKRADKVVAIELDDRLPALLAETLEDFDNVTIVPGDVMKIDLQDLFAREFAGRKVVVCANLPYYITSPVLMRLLEEHLPVEQITVMVQKEAAVRICAQPGTRAVGAVSLAVRYYAEPQILFNVSRGSFMPAPNVDSSVIALRLRKEPPVQLDDEKSYFTIVKAAFSQRRKTLCNSLASGLSIPKEEAANLIAAAGLAANVRPEQLMMEDFARIANLYAAHR